MLDPIFTSTEEGVFFESSLDHLGVDGKGGHRNHLIQRRIQIGQHLAMGKGWKRCLKNLENVWPEIGFGASGDGKFVGKYGQICVELWIRSTIWEMIGQNLAVDGKICFAWNPSSNQRCSRWWWKPSFNQLYPFVM